MKETGLRANPEELFQKHWERYWQASSIELQERHDSQLISVLTFGLCVTNAGGISFIVKRIFLHRVHNGPDIFQRYAGIQAVNHHQSAIFAAQLCYLVTYQRVHLSGSAVRGDFLAINVQINADAAFQILRDPINAVDQVLQIQCINAAFKKCRICAKLNSSRRQIRSSRSGSSSTIY